MKRVYKSPATPERLCSYVKAFPDETWEHFRRRNRRGYREVKQQLLQQWDWCSTTSFLQAIYLQPWYRAEWQMFPKSWEKPAIMTISLG